MDQEIHRGLSRGQAELGGGLQFADDISEGAETSRADVERTNALLDRLVACHPERAERLSCELAPLCEPGDEPDPDYPIQLPRTPALIRAIVKQVATYRGLTVAEMLVGRKSLHDSRSRQIACYLLSKLTGASLKQIGGALGGQDHTTVLHAIRRITELVMVDQELACAVTDLRTMILEAYPSIPAEAS